MADVNFTIAIDKEATSGDVSRILNDIEVQLSAFGQKSDMAGQGVGKLEDKMSRLANVRTPNLLASANAQLIQMIPLAQNNAAAMTLMQTTAYGATTAISSLMGPVGAIAIGVAVLGGLAIALSGTKKNIDELTEAAIKSANVFAQLAEAGFEVSAEWLTRLKSDALDTEASIYALQFRVQELTDAGGGFSTEAMDLTKTIAGLQLKALDLHKAILNIENAMSGAGQSSTSLTGMSNELSESWKKGADILNNQMTPAMRIFQGELDKLKMSTPAESPMEQGLRDLQALLAEIQGQKQIETILIDQAKVEAEMEDAKNAVRQKINEMHNQIRASNQAFWTSNVLQPIEQGFVNLFSGVEVKWSELIQRMAAEMMVSAIFKLISGFLFGPAGFGFQEGTSYVPQTGPYVLHKGERVMTAEENQFYRTTNNKYMGGNTIIINNYGAESQDRKALVKQLRETLEFREFDL